MSTYVQFDKEGNIFASAIWPFPGSTKVDYEVVRGYDGRLYKAGTEPVKSEEEFLAEAKQQAIADFDAALLAVDQRLIRPLANGETERVAELNELQAQNRALRAQVLEAKTVEEVQAIQPVAMEVENHG